MSSESIRNVAGKGNPETPTFGFAGLGITRGAAIGRG
jgi:hypothetical protein